MSVNRTPLHTRTITLEGFARDDGLFDIDARLTDVKHYRMHNWPGGALQAGEAMHDMVATLTVDTAGTIRGFTARAQAHPHTQCQTGAANFSRLEGLSIRKGFMKAVAERLGPQETCTHIREMLQQMATVAFQSMREARHEGEAAQGSARKPVLLNSCVSWAADGDWVKVRFPAYYTGPDKPPADMLDRSAFEARLRREGYLDTEIRRMAPGQAVAEHTHDYDVLAQVFAGEVTITREGESRCYRPGDIVELPAGVPHTEVCGPLGYTFMVGRRHRPVSQPAG